MQIITINDVDFPNVLTAFKKGKALGKYRRNGTVQVVCATPQFLLVSQGEDPAKIALKPTRSLTESETYGLRLLSKEKDRGSEVEIAER